LQAQGKEIAELKAALKEQAAQLQKVSARLEANTPAARLVDRPPQADYSYGTTVSVRSFPSPPE